MKKWVLILLAALLLLAGAYGAPRKALAQNAPERAAVLNEGEDPSTEPVRPPMPQEPEYEPLPESGQPLYERVLGDWYADYAGLVLTLSLSQGSYTLSAPGAETLTGTWKVKDGGLVLDGSERDTLAPVNDGLRWDSANLMFTRQQPQTYVPAEPLAEVSEGAFDGFWKSRYVGVRGGAVLSAVMGEDTFVYVEGVHVALGGARFVDVIKTFTFENGTLTLLDEDMAVTLELLQDGFLRLTFAGQQPMTIYLMPAAIPGR